MDDYKQQYYIRQLRKSNNRKVAILGSGLVSYIGSKLLKDSIVLTKKRTDLFINNVFFHDTIENRLMLHLLHLDYESRVVPVWYYDNLKDDTTTVLTKEIAIKIAQEKMGTATDDVIISGMTLDKPDFVNLFFNEESFKNELLHQSETIELFPMFIDESEDHVTIWFNGDDFIEVEYLINTIPQNIFGQLSYEPFYEKYQFKPLVFITTPINAPDSMTYSYNDCKWKRQFIKNNILCIEFNKEDYSLEILTDYFPEVANGTFKVTEIPYGRISSVEVHDSERIKHIGRFAQWNHSITTEHVINKLINLNL